jgi:hypothetical protein
MSGQAGNGFGGLPARDGVPGLDTRHAHSARVYNYWLGGKDNISQVVSEVPHSDLTLAIQARHAHYSKIASRIVRELSGTYIGGNVRFVGWGVLTLA